MKKSVFIIIFFMVIISVGLIAGTLISRIEITSTGKLKVVKVNVYKDIDCIDKVSEINWGVLEPGESKNFTCYIRNESNTNVTLSMTTANWVPNQAAYYISLSWNLEGVEMSPDEIMPCNFTLTVSSSIYGITNFSFDIMVVGEG